MKINESYLFTIVLSLWLYNQDKITGACKNHLIFSPYRKAIKIAFCYANWELKKSFEISIPKSPKCHGTKCHAILPWHNYVTKIFSKSPKCHRTKCHDILPWHNYVTKIFVMPFYPDIIMAPKIWLSPRNVTLENVTTYFVRQMNRPVDVIAKLCLSCAILHPSCPIIIYSFQS